MAMPMCHRLLGPFALYSAGKYPHSTGVYGNKTNLRNAPKAKDLLTIPQYFSKHGYHSLSRGKIFHVHPADGDKRGDQGQWAFDEWHASEGWAGPISKERPVNGLPNLPGDKGYHTTGFDWGPTVGNDETKMKGLPYSAVGSRAIQGSSVR